VVHVTGTIPIIICIDVEPDDFSPAPDRPVPWHGFEASADLAHSLRTRLGTATAGPARFSWFVRADPQVALIYGAAGWAFSRYASLIAELVAAGDEIGLHAHAARYAAETDAWIEDFGSGDWIAACVTTGFDAYARAFGRPSRSVRMGNHFMNDPTSDLVERLGARYDLTPEPGARPRSRLGGRLVMTGELPDYSALSCAAYRRSARSFRESDAGRDGLWVVPLSTAVLDADAPAEARRASDDGASLRLGLWYPPAAFRYVFESCLQRSGPFHLALVMRSSMPLTPAFDAAIRDNIEFIARHPLAPRFVVCGPEEAVGLLDSRVY
jgi:hypothetical protein